MFVALCMDEETTMHISQQHHPLSSLFTVLVFLISFYTFEFTLARHNGDRTRSKIENLQKQIHSGLYPLLQGYYRNEGYDSDEIDQIWAEAIKDFGDFAENDRTVDHATREHYQILRQALRPRVMPRPPVPKYKNSDDLDIDFGFDKKKYNYFGEVKKFLENWDEDDKKMNQQFLNYLTHDEEGNENEFGRFIGKMEKFEEKVNKKPKKWFEMKKDSNDAQSKEK